MNLANDDEWKEIFLAHLRNTGNASFAAKAVGLNRRAVYYHKKHDPEFRDRWQEAISTAVDDLEEAGRNLALSGNATMIIFMLKHLRPSVYRERVQLDVNSLENEARRLGLEVDDVLAEVDLLLTGEGGDALPYER